MKKLNRKGFTLVELLAVIIILAIVVGITIPAITNIINDSKNNAMGVAVDAAADYLTDQYGYMNIDRGTATGDFITAFGAGQTVAKYPGTAAETGEGKISDTLLKEMGLDKNNVVSLEAKLTDSTGNICVKITKVQNTSEYYTTTFFGTDGVPKTTGTNIAKSSNCD